MAVVLVLDDDPGSRVALRAVLEQEGHSVVEAMDEPAAIQVCTGHTVDLLVADVLLRSHDGPQTARRLRTLQPDMPILYMSGHSVETLLNRALLQPGEVDDSGVAFLQKPFLLTRFVETVDELIGRAWYRGRPRVILVVDDEPVVRELIRRVLVRRKFTVLDAGDGPQALDAAANFGDPIDLMITDVIMPGMSGVELAGHLSQQRPEVKVLYISGHTELWLPPAEGGRGAAFLAKPFTPTALLAKLEELLGGCARRT
jgi:CheY-like chemotaxis protein